MEYITPAFSPLICDLLQQMAKNKPRRKSTSGRTHKAPPTKLAVWETKRDLIPTRVLTRVNLFTNLATAVLIVVIAFNMNRILNEAGKLLLLCFIIFLIVGIIRLRIQGSTLDLLTRPKWDTIINKKFRRRTIWLLTLGFFNIVISAMPLLYLHGYVTQFTNWLQPLLPGKQKIGENLSLFIAFCAGAIFSGILGNLAYDLLKRAFKKMREKDSES